MKKKYFRMISAAVVIDIFRVNNIWPRGYKLFFMLNSAEHEICPANKTQLTNNCKIFLAKRTEHENFSANKYENANFCWYFHIY